MKSVRLLLITAACVSLVGIIVTLANAQTLPFPLPRPGLAACITDSVNRFHADLEACEEISEFEDPDAHSQCEVAAAEAFDEHYEACLVIFAPGVPPAE